MPPESKRTIEIYVRKYQEYLEANNEEVNVKTFSLWLTKMDLNPNSKAVLCARIGKFLVWNGNISKEDYKFLTGIFKLRSYNWSNKALTKEEAIRFMEIIRNESRTNFSKTRNVLIYLILLATGSRISQTLDLELEDIKEEEEGIKIRMKRLKYIEGDGNDYVVKKIRRDFVVGDKVFGNLWDKYMNLRDQVKTDSKRLFITQRGKPINQDEYRKVFQKASEKFGKKVTPHSIRHTVGTIYANQYGVLKASIVLGHSNLTTTQKYIKVNNIDVEELEW